MAPKPDLKSKMDSLNPPSKEYALASLAQYLGEVGAKNLWASACKECGVKDNPSSIHELETVFKHLSKEKGVTGILGMSLVIRAISYRTLNPGKQEDRT